MLCILMVPSSFTSALGGMFWGYQGFWSNWSGWIQWEYRKKLHFHDYYGCIILLLLLFIIVPIIDVQDHSHTEWMYRL